MYRLSIPVYTLSVSSRSVTRRSVAESLVCGPKFSFSSKAKRNHGKRQSRANFELLYRYLPEELPRYNEHKLDIKPHEYALPDGYFDYPKERPRYSEHKLDMAFNLPDDYFQRPLKFRVGNRTVYLTPEEITQIRKMKK